MKFFKGQESHNKTHGMTGTSTYKSWSHMKDRCLNPKCRAYPRYGGRGITIHPPWITSFEVFLEDMGVKPVGLSIERIDNDGNYTPDNCKWATYFQQNKNRSSNTEFPGVSWDKKNQKWCSELKRGGKRMLFKRYKTHLAACYARHQAELNLNQELR